MTGQHRVLGTIAVRRRHTAFVFSNGKGINLNMAGGTLAIAEQPDPIGKN